MIKIYRPVKNWSSWALLAIMLLSLHLSAYSSQDSSQITLHINNQPFEKVLRQIENQTGYTFFYWNMTLDGNSEISISVDQLKLSQVMEILLKGRNLTWKIKNKGIVLSKRKDTIDRVDLKNIAIDTVPKFNISGIVVDPQGKPIPGATVSVRGQSRGIGTDNLGRFGFMNIPLNTILVVSSIGYDTKQVRLNGQNEIRIKLDTLIREIAAVEVFSTGYQSISKDRATGSFVQLDNKSINRTVSTNILERIINVTSSLKTEKGAKSNISIRGFSTINANTQPLIVIDGFPYQDDPDQGKIILNNINPNDIESITILRDAASASIWGARSGNGVIVVNTKKGSYNKRMTLQVNANINFTQKPDLNSLKIISSKEAIELERMRFNKGVFNIFDDTYPAASYFPYLSPAIEILLAQRRGVMTKDQADLKLDRLSNHDVRDDINKYLLQTSVNQQYSLNISGGTARNGYYASIGYDDNMSNMIKNSDSRISLRFDNTFKPFQNLEINSYIVFVQTRTNNNSLDYKPYLATGQGRAVPYAQFADENGNSLHVPSSGTYRTSYIDTASYPGLLDWHYKPLDELKNKDDISKQYSTRMGGSAKYTILPGVSIEAKGQYERRNGNSNSLFNQNTYATRNLINSYMYVASNGQIQYPIPLGNILSYSNSDQTSWNIRGQLNVNKTIKKIHEINAIMGYEASQTDFFYNSGIKYGYNPVTSSYKTDIDYVTSFILRPIGNLGAFPISSSDAIRGTLNRFQSYFGNVGYSYQSKYTVTLSSRIDKSNFLGAKANQRAIPLYSSGVGWNISNESFYQIKWLPFLKMRATYGYNGNLNNKATALPTARIFPPTNNYHNAPYLTLQTPPNPGLTWEKIRIINYGIDYGTSNNRISGSLEYYTKNGINLIGDIIAESTTGITSYTGNYANMKGQGIDLIFNSDNLNKSLIWRTNFLLSYNTDKITNYIQQNVPTATYVNSIGLPIIGKPITKIYSYPFAGLNPTNGDPQGYLKGAVVDYLSVWKDAKVEDIKYHGSATPLIFGSLINTFTYKNFSLSANITYKFKYYFRRSTIQYVQLFDNWGGHSDYSLRWKKPGDEVFTAVPSLPLVEGNSVRDAFTALGSNLVEKGDHIRLRDLKLSYELRKANARKSPFNEASLYIYANNIGILWRANKHRLDPDILSTDIPPVKSVAIGVSLNL